jgi:hypothetical protein
LFLCCFSLSFFPSFFLSSFLCLHKSSRVHCIIASEFSILECFLVLALSSFWRMFLP